MILFFEGCFSGTFLVTKSSILNSIFLLHLSYLSLCLDFIFSVLSTGISFAFSKFICSAHECGLFYWWCISICQYPQAISNTLKYFAFRNLSNTCCMWGCLLSGSFVELEYSYILKKYVNYLLVEKMYRFEIFSKY